MLHCKWAGRAYQDHYHHHWEIYPPNDFLSDEYREPPKGAEQGKYYVGAVAVLFSPVILYSFWIYLLVVVEAVMILKLNAYVHDSLHVKGHWLERFKLFHKLRKIHFKHHIEDVNYGIFDFTADLVFRTWKRKK